MTKLWRLVLFKLLTTHITLIVDILSDLEANRLNFKSMEVIAIDYHAHYMLPRSCMHTYTHKYEL